MPVIHRLIGHIPTGTKVGRWTVLFESDRRYVKLRHMRCRCECGTERDVFIGSLRTGASSSCGCHKSDKSRKHGLCNTPEYVIWRGMNSRCRNTKSACYKNY